MKIPFLYIPRVGKKARYGIGCVSDLYERDIEERGDTDRIMRDVTSRDS